MNDALVIEGIRYSNIFRAFSGMKPIENPHLSNPASSQEKPGLNVISVAEAPVIIGNESVLLEDGKEDGDIVADMVTIEQNTKYKNYKIIEKMRLKQQEYDTLNESGKKLLDRNLKNALIYSPKNISDPVLNTKKRSEPLNYEITAADLARNPREKK